MLRKPFTSPAAWQICFLWRFRSPLDGSAFAMKPAPIQLAGVRHVSR